MGIIEFILYPFYVAFFYFVFRAQRNNYTDPVLKYYHVHGFWIKVLTALLFAFFNWKLSRGDSFVLYHIEGKNIYDLVLKDFSNIKWIGVRGENFDETLLRDPWNKGYLKGEANFMVVRFVAIISFFTLGKYLLTNLVFSLIAFTGTWKLFLFFYAQYPHLHRKLAIAILYLPTFIFWSSGIVKDSICITAMGWITYSLYQIFFKKRDIAKSIFFTLVFGYFLWVIKPYILISYIPFLVLFLILKNVNLVNSMVLKLILTPSLIIGSIFAFIFTMNQLNDELGKYASDNLANNIKKQAGAFEAQANLSDEVSSNFSYGIEFDGSLSSLGKLAPVAVATTLFRPFIWESKRPMTILSSLEGLALIIFTISVFFKAGIKTVFQTLTKNPLALYCFLFAILFALFVGATTLNFGSLCRYKIPCMPFYVIAIFLIQDAAAQKKESLLKIKQVEV